MNFYTCAANNTFLSKQAPTRGGSSKALCDSILINETHLTSIFNAAGFVADGRDRKGRDHRQDVMNSINNPEFALSLRKICKVLKPVCDYVVRFQKDSVPVSEVYDFFSSHKAKYRDMHLSSDNDRAILCNIIAMHRNSIPLGPRSPPAPFRLD